MLVRSLALFLMVTALAVLLILPASAAQMTLEQAELTPIPKLTDKFIGGINPDNLGNLIVSHEYGQIWKINPLSGGYTIYDPGFGYLTDAHFDGSSKYWFTDGVDQVGYANITNQITYYWDVGTDPSKDYQFSALVVESSNRIWLADSIGTELHLYLLKYSPPTSAEFCSLGGEVYYTSAYDLIVHAGSLWFFNWNKDEISRLNLTPNEDQYSMTTWPVQVSSTEAIEGRVLAFDSENQLWIPGGGAGTIMSFNPDSGILTTYTAPIGTPSIEGVAVLDDRIYFADHTGSAGYLDPGLAVGEAGEPVTPSTVLLTPQCAPLGNPISFPFSDAIREGFLPFSTSGAAPSSLEGWTIYPLSALDELYGIGAAQGRVFISDSRLDPQPSTLRSSWLLRFRPEISPGDKKIFLPMILK